jgi:hypothetical protein
LYIVHYTNWAYNDQWHYETDGGLGEPIKAFTSREKAEAHRRELELTRAHDEFDQYSRWSSDEPSLEYWIGKKGEEDFVKLLAKIGAPPRTAEESWQDWLKRAQLTKEHLVAIWEHFGISFYTVSKLCDVEIG